MRVSHHFGRACCFVTVSLAVAWGGLCLGLRAGEQVRFSDSSGPVLTPDATRRNSKLEGSLGGFMDRGSSVSGVGAVPFSTVYSGSKAGRVRDKDLLDSRRLDWIRRSPDELGVTDLSAGKAFGVRDYSLPDSGQAGPGGRDGATDDMGEKGKDADKPGADPSLKNPSLTPAGERPFQGPEGVSATDGLGTLRDFSEMSVPGFSDHARFAGSFMDKEQDSLRESLLRQGGGITGLMRPNARLAPAVRQERQRRADEFNKLLDGPSGSGSVAKPLAGALDPVNLYPDITRQGLNPVVGANAKELNSAVKPSFSDSLRPLAASPSFGSPGVLNSMNSKALAPPTLVRPNGPPLVESRKPQAPVPLLFDMPRRAF